MENVANLLQLFSEAIQTYVDLLQSANEQVNLYSKKTYDHLPFHIQDSLNLAEMANHAKIIVDMGSGSGFPSVIMAIQNPQSQVVAIESKGKKRRF